MKTGGIMYIVFVVIPRIPSDEGYSFSQKSGAYRDYIPVFRTSDEEVAKAVAELLTKDYEGGPGEDYPEGFIFKSEAEMSLKERIRAHEQLSNLEEWALQMHEIATRYAEKAHMLALGDTETNQPSTAAREEGDYCFRRYSEYWKARFEDEDGSFRDTKGFAIIHKLLRDSSPKCQISALELAGMDENLAKVPHSYQNTLDNEAFRRLKQEIEDYEELISDAQQKHSCEQLELLTQEKEKLVAELIKATGIYGKSRLLGPQSPRKNAQVRVRRAFTRALARIQKDMPKLAAHLSDRIFTGSSCYYTHDNSFEWQLD